MKLIKPGIEILETITPYSKTLYGIMLNKLFDELKLSSQKPSNKFYNLLEHGTIYLKRYSKSSCDNIVFNCDWNSFIAKYQNNPRSMVGKYIPNITANNGHIYITTTYKEIIINGWEDDLQYICEPTENHEKRYTIKFIDSREILQEFSGYNQFTKTDDTSENHLIHNQSLFHPDDNQNEITYVIPKWLKDVSEWKIEDITNEEWKLQHTSSEEWEIKDITNHVKIYTDYAIATDKGSYSVSPESGLFIETLNDIEKKYFNLINLGCTPQQAKQILPNSIKTQLIITGFTSQWKHLFQEEINKEIVNSVQKLKMFD